MVAAEAAIPVSGHGSVEGLPTGMVAWPERIEID